MKDSRQHDIDFDKLNKKFEKYECDGQLSFIVRGTNLVIVESTQDIEVIKVKED